MPGELGDEGSFSSSQQVGYYEHRYPQQTKDTEWMDDERKTQGEDDKRKRETQKERLVRRWRRNFINQPQTDCSMLPTGGPEQGKL